MLFIMSYREVNEKTTFFALIEIETYLLKNFQKPAENFQPSFMPMR